MKNNAYLLIYFIQFYKLIIKDILVKKIYVCRYNYSYFMRVELDSLEVVACLEARSLELGCLGDFYCLY